MEMGEMTENLEDFAFLSLDERSREALSQARSILTKKESKTPEVTTPKKRQADTTLDEIAPPSFSQASMASYFSPGPGKRNQNASHRQGKK